MWALAFLTLLFGLLGAVFGSFLGCMAYRLKAGVPLRQPPSFCPACKTTLTPLDLIPIFSWLCSRGRCRHCHVVIGWQPVVLETLCAVWAIGVFWVCGLSFFTPLFWLGGWGIFTVLLTLVSPFE